MERNGTLSLEAEPQLSLYNQQVKHPSLVSQGLAVSFISSRVCCEHAAVTVLLKVSHLLSCPLFTACSQQLGETSIPAASTAFPQASPCCTHSEKCRPRLSFGPTFLLDLEVLALWWATANARVKEEKNVRFAQFTHTLCFYLEYSLTIARAYIFL